MPLSFDDDTFVVPPPVVADQVNVGTEQILESPHVSEGPGRIANAPCPSVYFDDRGEIHRLRVGGKRLNLLFSKKRVMRSGYLHPNTTYDFVVSGKVEVWTLGQTQTHKKVYGTREAFEIDPYVPHILHFLEDSILLERWEGDFQCWYYHPYRRLLNVQNSHVSKSAGTMHRLVPQDTYASGSGDEASNGWTRTVGAVLWWSIGLGMGVVAGIALCQPGEGKAPTK